jgi:hypothetical protein
MGNYGSGSLEVFNSNSSGVDFRNTDLHNPQMVEELDWTDVNQDEVISNERFETRAASRPRFRACPDAIQ